MIADESSDPLIQEIVAAMRTVHDPELPVNIYDLGLIYAIELDNHRNVFIQMTLTSPGCPVAGSLPLEVERMVRGVPSIRDVVVRMVWDPPWTKDLLSEATQLELGLL